jgi:hypothetical protein
MFVLFNLMINQKNKAGRINAYTIISWGNFLRMDVKGITHGINAGKYVRYSPFTTLAIIAGRGNGDLIR